jgi:hypothetical protein
MDAMSHSAPQATGILHSVARTTCYRGGADWLVLWGPGAPDRREPMRRQLAAGGRVIALDLSYWDRPTKFRVSIDAAHPQAWVLRGDWPMSRWDASGLACESAWDPRGPVIVAGIGDKARIQYGRQVADWETAMTLEARRRGYRVVYRPKLRHQLTPIETALRGAAAVITWHSNVAVDAIRLGVPVICRDGAAAAICPSQWTDGRPEPVADDLRRRFLANLAWFQWAPTETSGYWAFLRDLLCAS